MSSPIAQAIKDICEEKKLSYEAVLETIEFALAAAYRKDFGEKNQNIQVEFNPDTGEMKAFDVKTVVEDVDLEAEAAEIEKAKENYAAQVKEAEEKGEISPEIPVFKRFNPKLEWMVSEAKKEYPGVKIGEVIRRPLEIPSAFGRMAAQTAKQVIIQKLREAEREKIYGEFKGREGEIVIGAVGRREGRNVLIDLEQATAILPAEEQIAAERYNPGARLKVYVLGVNMGSRGPEIRVSRAHPEMVKKIFETEIPEIGNGLVEIKGVAREAGARSKVAVWTREEAIDPIGSCIGQRGARIQTIIAELGGEKIDIILFDENISSFIGNALSPAKALAVELDEETKSAKVLVAPEQYSLAIGRGGQNVRLASQLTGWQIIVEQEGEKKAEEEKIAEENPPPIAEEKPAEESSEV
ncbi:MAG: transcription termination/antitermination protein NusA [Candidatus Magasanikbacteria bacterium]|nr:transcription termination/antitermination protein NusA [Candidatus Magasanikbacteria bacterium]